MHRSATHSCPSVNVDRTEGPAGARGAHVSPVGKRSFVDDLIRISAACRPGVEIVSVSGELDAFSAHHLKRWLGDPAKVSQPQVILDLSHVTFMDAGAVGAIVHCRRMLTARNADLCLVCPAGPALRLMRLLGLDRVWTIYPTREDASGV